MIHAVIHDGEVRLAEPLPSEWPEGQALQIDKFDESESTTDEIERDFAILEAMCAAGDPEDDERLERALAEADREAKDYVRREMGLS